jgi:prohibitin 2
MGYFTLVGLLVLIAAALFYIGRNIGAETDRDLIVNKRGGVSRSTLGRLLQSLSYVAVASIIFVSLAASIHQIPAGYVGVVYEFGAIRGQIGEGLQFIAPWRTVRLANIQVQRHVFDKLAAFSEESQDVFVKATLNIRVSPQAVQQLYRTVGPNFFNVLVESRVIQNFKDETVKYKSVDIAPHREDIRKVVRKRLEKELSPYSIEVDDLLLDNIDFQPEFKKAIEDKQIATQRALEEQQKVEGEKYRAQQAIERAKGEGSAILFRAEKEAEANRKLAASLTPELVQYSLVQKLSDKIQVMMLPAGQNFILDSGMLKPTKAAK